MKTDIIKTIADMKSKGELSVDSSLALILQVLSELYEGQTEIVKSLSDRQDSIEDLKKQLDAHEATTGTNTSEHEDIKKRLEVVEKDVETVKNSSVIIWMNKHPKITIGLSIIGLLAINFHEHIFPFIWGIFGYKIPGG